MTRLENPNDWIKGLREEVENRKKHVATVEERAQETLAKLRMAVVRDAGRLNNEIYDGSSVLEVSRLDPEIGFSVEHDRIDLSVEVRLLIDRDRLEYRFDPSGQTIEFQIVVDKSGGLSFFDQQRVVELEEISRGILEPIVRSDFRIAAKR